MKKAAIVIISIYQNTISIFLKQLLGTKSMCRFTPSCSEYTKIAIEKYGLIKGTRRGLIRLLHCQPFSSYYTSSAFEYSARGEEHRRVQQIVK